MEVAVSDLDIELDWISCEILIAINKNGQTATTSEIKRLTGVEEGTKVPYRMKSVLAPADLIELTRRGVDESGQNLPLKATLTDHGAALAQKFEEADDVADTRDVYTDKLNARLTRIESQLDQLDTDGGPTDDSLSDIQNQIDELDEKIESLYQNMVRFRDYLNERDDGGYSEYVEQIENSAEG